MFIQPQSTALKKRRLLRRLGLFAGGCLIAILAFNFAGDNSRSIRHNGKELPAWEKDIIARMANGSYERTIRSEVQRMGPETLPYWFERLQASDSLPTLSYSRFWQLLTPSLQMQLPRPISQAYRRNVIRGVLRDMMPFLVSSTNGIPELIRLSHSPDMELHCYAVQLLS